MPDSSLRPPRAAPAALLACVAILACALVWPRIDASASDAVVTGWMAGLQGRTSPPPAGCTAEQRPARPPIAAYPVCADQIALFAGALEEAAKTGRLLLVDFGATWCPSCRGLKQAVKDARIFGPDLRTGALAHDIAVLPIGLSALGGGRMVQVDSGQAILTRLLVAAPEARFRAYPMIALLDPRDASRIVIRNLDDIVLDGARVPVGPLADVIAAARDHLRSGSGAPAEPIWLVRKISRIWQRIW